MIRETQIVNLVLAVPLLMLLLLLLLALSVAGREAQAQGAIVYVDVSNTGLEDGSRDHPWNTIAEGLNNALDGDTVRVAQGMYAENLTIARDIFLEGGYASFIAPISWTRSITLYETIVNGGGNDSVILVAPGCAPTIDGFTITDGSAPRGGGIYAEGASPTISHNTITNNMGSGAAVYVCCGGRATVENNTISYNGGKVGDVPDLGCGIYVEYNASVTIRDNLIFGNSCASGGGGIGVRQFSSATIVGNTISNNHVRSHGGGVGVKLYSTVTLSDNVLTNNTAGHLGGGLYIRFVPSITVSNNIITGSWTAGHGGGVWIYESAPMLISNTITENGAALTGGGVGINTNASGTLEGNLISGNRAREGAGINIDEYSRATLTGDIVIGNEATMGGGGIKVTGHYTGNPYAISVTNSLVAHNTTRKDGGGMMIEGASASIVNSTIVDNKADGIGGGIYSLDGSVPDVEIVNSILWSNGGDDLSDADYEITYSDVEESLLPGEGNISVDPLFVDQTGGDYHLSTGSPVIDAGTNIRAPQFDFEGDQRPFDGNGDGEATVDMGADEYRPSVDGSEIYLPIVLKSR
jgi:hypothetical protein